MTTAQTLLTIAADPKHLAAAPGHVRMRVFANVHWKIAATEE
jgi:hypothetical protein